MFLGFEVYHKTELNTKSIKRQVSPFPSIQLSKSGLS